MLSDQLILTIFSIEDNVYECQTLFRSLLGHQDGDSWQSNPKDAHTSLERMYGWPRYRDHLTRNTADRLWCSDRQLIIERRGRDSPV